MIEELVARVFYTRNVSHLFHWKTQSYATHKALGKFYTVLPDKIDAVVEAYQGAFALIGAVPALPPDRNLQILPHLEAEAAWINSNCEAIARGNYAVENMLQDLLGHYLSVIYKLRNLH